MYGTCQELPGSKIKAPKDWLVSRAADNTNDVALYKQMYYERGTVDSKLSRSFPLDLQSMDCSEFSIRCGVALNGRLGEYYDPEWDKSTYIKVSLLVAGKCFQGGFAM